MKLINKQPVFDAEQFDNSEAGVKRLHVLIGRHAVESWQLTQPSIGKAKIVFKVHGKTDITLTEGEWLIRHPDGTTAVVDSEYLEDKFDKVPSTSAPFTVNLQGQTFGGIASAVSGSINTDPWKRGLV